MDRYRAGELEAFTELCELFESRVSRFLRNRVGCEHTADDLLQRVFLNLNRVITKPEFVITYCLFSYCMTIAANESKSHLRKKLRRSKILAQSDFDGCIELAADAPEEDSDDAIEKLQVAIATLPQREGQILRWVYWEGVSTTTIAEELGLSPRRILQIIDATLERLRLRFTATTEVRSLEPGK